MQINWFMLTLMVIFGGTGLVQLYKVFRLYRKISASRGWPETIATITQARAETSRPGQWGGNFWASFGYSYLVSEARHEGNFKIEDLLGSEAYAKSAAARHPVGATFKLRYNPEKPEEAVTEFDKVMGPGLGLGAAAVLLAVVFAFFL